MPGSFSYRNNWFVRNVLGKMPDLTQVAVLHNMQKKVTLWHHEQASVSTETVFLALNCLKLHIHLFPIGLPLPHHRVMWLLRHITIAHQLRLSTYPQPQFSSSVTASLVKSFRMFAAGFKGHIERGSPGDATTPLYFLTSSKTGRKPLTS